MAWALILDAVRLRCFWSCPKGETGSDRLANRHQLGISTAERYTVAAICVKRRKGVVPPHQDTIWAGGEDEGAGHSVNTETPRDSLALAQPPPYIGETYPRMVSPTHSPWPSEPGERELDWSLEMPTSPDSSRYLRSYRRR